jgi:hypothetical protein
VGDGRLLGSARRVDVAGRLVAPAFAASVRGLGARSWLTPEALVDVGRLGVARLLWHVASSDRLQALAHAGALAAPGRPSVEIVDANAPAMLLEIGATPGAPASASVEAALDALCRGSWRPGAAGRPLAALLGELAGAESGASSPLVAPDARASLLVLRSRGDVALDLSSLDLEVVFIDGREPGGSR